MLVCWVQHQAKTQHWDDELLCWDGKKNAWCVFSLTSHLAGEKKNVLLASVPNETAWFETIPLSANLQNHVKLIILFTLIKSKSTIYQNHHSQYDMILIWHDIDTIITRHVVIWYATMNCISLVLPSTLQCSQGINTSQPPSIRLPDPLHHKGPRWHVGSRTTSGAVWKNMVKWRLEWCYPPWKSHFLPPENQWMSFLFGFRPPDRCD